MKLGEKTREVALSEIDFGCSQLAESELADYQQEYFDEVDRTYAAFLKRKADSVRGTAGAL